ncbi:Cloroperoxidase [Coprinopsis marcescibilis]|uniref:Cloroperoxidase n=1 Tax=Coprinopsis marcescibilis TaxID=230819 RepID=A0A5C3KMJ0_COPMA|nr:Cloroperoxidase [Coprinopsis marcescibilis]
MLYWLSVATALITAQSFKASAFPAYASLGGLSQRELDVIVPSLPAVYPPPPPPPPSYTGTKLVHDPDHPWQPQKPGDLRGPCPGLNTLASHGYLPRDGVATPEQLIIAAQEGLNMNNRLARFATYSTFLLDGNIVTNLVSIGGKSNRTGVDPPFPAIVGGMSNHGTFEGDTSMTRADAYFGDNSNFDQERFNQFRNFSYHYGDGYYNLTVAAELRYHLIQQSIATNPEFSMMGFRHLTAYGEATFPATMFVDGRTTGSEEGQLDMDTAESFFKHSRFPVMFHRSNKPRGIEPALDLLAVHPMLPGRNVAGVNSFVADLSMGSTIEYCNMYTQLVNETIRGLYPNPTGVLKRNLKINLRYFYQSLEYDYCIEVFPYGMH